eukprot:2431321-Rhodomonas_salina.2
MSATPGSAESMSEPKSANLTGVQGMEHKGRMRYPPEGFKLEDGVICSHPEREYLYMSSCVSSVWSCPPYTQRSSPTLEAPYAT